MQFTEKVPEISIERKEFQSGDSFYKILAQEGVDVYQTTKIVELFSQEISIRKIQSGQFYEVEKSSANEFLAISYLPNQIEKYRVYVSSVNQELAIEVQRAEIKSKILCIEGEITSSLYEAVVGNKHGNPALAVELTEIFAWQIDFFTDTRPGDKFLILYENLYTDTGYSKLGRIFAAKYIGSNYEYSAFYFKHNEVEGYYDEAGKAMKRAFLKSPLNYKRISSYFSLSRMHPILKYRRPHLGIDYAAKEGTPIVSIGDGRVVFAGVSGGFGKLLKIVHSNNYESWYGHLRGYAAGIHVGAKVKQGQTIAYVGQTGLATGPHLDFRFKHNGTFINYLAMKIPSAMSVKKDYMPAFEIKRNEYLELIKTKQNE